MKNQNNKNFLNLLKDLCLIPGFSGHEDQVRSFISKELLKSGILSKSDVLGNLICTLPGKDNVPAVMLFTHMDQLGLK